MIPRIAAVFQLGIAAFLVLDYLNDRENPALTFITAGALGLTALGMLAAQRWALHAALTVNTLLVIALWGTAIDRGTSNVVLGAAALSLPWLLLFPYWLRDRSRRRRAQAAQPEAVQPTGAPEQDASGWTKEWGGGRVKFWGVLLFGVLCLVAGFGMLSDGETVLGISMLGFGVALAGGSPMFRTWDRDGRITVVTLADRGEKAQVFPYSRAKTVAATLASSGMAVCCGGVALGAFNE